MKQITNPLFQSLAAIGFLIFITAPMSHSATIANWKVLAGTAVGSNLSTDSPTIGDGTLNNADASNSAGRFGTVASPESVTLAVGQTLTVSTTVVLTGGNASQDFRFGVFNAATEFASGTTTFASGGILLQPANGIVTPGRFYQARTDGNFGSTATNAVLIGGTVTTSGTLDVDSTIPLTWTLSITRDSATTVDLFGSIIGGDGNYNFSVTANDVVNLPDPTPTHRIVGTRSSNHARKNWR